MNVLSTLISSVLFASCVTTAPTKAGEIEGVVVMVGSLPNARPVVESDGAKSQVETCAGPMQDYLRKFGGTIIKGKGEWSTNAATKERCFNLSDFEVTQLIKNRPAFTGILSKNTDGSLALKTLSGATMALESPSKKITTLTGKKVVMDLTISTKTSTTADAVETWKVVSFMEFPDK
jgi:hypothetical protein